MEGIPAVKSTEGRKLPRRPLGWREWVALPELGVPWTKAKLDTGARSSAIHAFDIEPYTEGGERRVRFQLHPRQRRPVPSIEADAAVLGTRQVRSSTGHHQERLLIRTPIELAGERYDIELTLASRDAMGFRMLLGRQALRGHFLVDPGRSFVAGRPTKPWKAWS